MIALHSPDLLRPIRNTRQDLLHDLDRFVNISDPNQEARVMAEIFPVWRFRTIISKLGRDQKWIEDVLKGSYLHENGFIKLVLASSNGAKLRVHFRPPAVDSSSAENIHQHRWSFGSHIIAGKLEVQTYGDIPIESTQSGAILLDEFVYRPTMGGDFYTITPFKKTKLITLSTERYAAGSAYSVDSSVLHRVMASQPGSGYITVVITRPATSESCRLLANRPIDIGEVKTRKLTEEQLFAALDYMTAFTS